MRIFVLAICLLGVLNTLYALHMTLLSVEMLENENM